MKNRTLQVLLLAAAAFASTAHCGKSDPTVTPALGPTDVVVTWTFDGKPASGMECVSRGIASVVITLSATNDVALHQNTTVDCDKGTVTFAGLDTAGLGMPFLEGTVIDGKGMTLTRTDTTVVPKPGKTAVTLDFFPSTPMTTSGDPATTSGDPSTAASSGGGGMGGMGGMSSTSAASTAASTAAASTAASTSAGAGGASSSSTGP